MPACQSVHCAQDAREDRRGRPRGGPESHARGVSQSAPESDHGSADQSGYQNASRDPWQYYPMSIREFGILCPVRRLLLPSTRVSWLVGEVEMQRRSLLVLDQEVVEPICAELLEGRGLEIFARRSV